MNATDDNQDHNSYFDEHARRLEASALPPGAEELRELLAALLTLLTYRHLLYDPNTHLMNDITEEFLNKVMIPDLGRIIVAIREYRGGDRRGLREAAQLVDSALSAAYRAESKPEQVEALIDCRSRLQEAYLQLEHLRTYIPPSLATRP